jgi:hypothetical protein
MLARLGTASSSESSSVSSALVLAMGHDTLDREIIEGGIEADTHTFVTSPRRMPWQLKDFNLNLQYEVNTVILMFSPLSMHSARSSLCFSSFPCH